MVFWATSKKNRTVNCICRFICLNNKRSWIKIICWIHIILAAMEADDGSVLRLMAIWTFWNHDCGWWKDPSDGHNQDIVCVQIQIEYSACVFSFHLYTEVAHFSYPSFFHFAVLTSFYGKGKVIISSEAETAL